MAEHRHPTVTLALLTLNEIESLKQILPRIDRSLFDQILVIDGNSTDGTPEWCRAQGLEVFTQRSSGLRQAYQDALPQIRSEYMITFSPDGNSVPERLGPLVDKLAEGYDMVIVSRYLEGAKSEDDDAVTAFGNWLFTKMVNVLHGGHYTDVMVMYRGYRTRLLRDLHLDGDDGFIVPERLFFCRIGMEPLLSTRAARARLKIAEIPGDEPKRIGGTRKLKIVRWGLAHVYQFIRECFAPRPKLG
jgi:glycosyltransferase involved in cell wall biosynthesis